MSSEQIYAFIHCFVEKTFEILQINDNIKEYTLNINSRVDSDKFINTKIGLEIINGIEEFMKKEGIKSLDEIRGII